MAVSVQLIASMVMVYSGLYRLGRLMLNHARSMLAVDSIQHELLYQGLTGVHGYMTGNWTEISEYDKLLFDSGASKGLFYDLCAYSVFKIYLKTYQGKFTEARKLVDDFLHMQEQYQCGPFTVSRLVPAEYLLCRRKLDAALTETSDGLSLAVEKGSEPFELLGVGLKAVIQLLMGDITGAKESLSRADQIRRKQPFWGPWYLSSGVLAQFIFDLQLLRDAVAEKNRSAVSATAKAALKSGKDAVKKSAGFPAYRAWNYRLMGDYHWLVGKQRRAMKWYERSIQEGERLGARPDLSRTYLEVGRRLLEPQSNYKKLNGIDANGYFEKAEMLFREMGLEKDMDDLERARLEL